MGARGSVVVKGTVVQARMSLVPFSIKSLDFLMYLILPAALCPWESTQSVTEMSTRNLPGGKEWPTGKADNLTAISEPIV
jgi:hypothetical protein